MRTISDQRPHLSRHLVSVLELKVKGYTTNEIAAELHIDVKSVKIYMHRIHLALDLVNQSATRKLHAYEEWLAEYYDSLKHPTDNITKEEQPIAANDHADAHDEVEDVPLQEQIDQIQEDFEIISRRYEIKSALIPIPSPQYSPEYPEYNNTSSGFFAVPTSRYPRWRALLLLLFVGMAGGLVASAAILLAQRSAQPALPVTIAATTPPDAVVTVTSPPTETVIMPEYVSICGESAPLTGTVEPQFLASEGVVVYTTENAAGVVMNDAVRNLTISPHGLWIGYPTSDEALGGLGFFDKKQWISCNQTPGITDKHVNDIEISESGAIWAATDKAGVSVFEGGAWKTFTTEDGLPNDITYDLAIDSQGQIFVATYDGVAFLSGDKWSVAYSKSNGTLFGTSVHAIAFGSQGDIWAGHVSEGISRYDALSGGWLHITEDELGSLSVRNILVRKATNDEPESVWVATDGGGISQYENNEWTRHTVETGLPSDRVMGLALDRYNRIWAATDAGVAYFDGEEWQQYHHLPATDVAIGPTCEGCPLDDDQVWTSTSDNGLTYSRLPLNEIALDLIDITYPKVLTPGESFQPEITVAPRAPYQLSAERGDQLVNIDADEFYRFGAHTHMAVTGVIQPGEPYIFTDMHTLFKAPELAPGEQEKTFTSTWRVWMHTRFVGPPIEITFTVRKSE
jgi:hypothetical protein